MQKLIGSCSSFSQKAFNENPVVFIFILYENIQVFENLEVSQFYSFFKNSTTRITPNSPRHSEPSSRLNLENAALPFRAARHAADSNLALFSSRGWPEIYLGLPPTRGKPRVGALGGGEGGAGEGYMTLCEGH